MDRRRGSAAGGGRGWHGFSEAKWILAASAVLVCGSVNRTAQAAQSDVWAAESPMTEPSLPAGMPPKSIGCVVVGFSVLADGSTVAPRVMKGTFSNDVPPELQDAFSREVVETARVWRYRAIRPSKGGFRWETVGFIMPEGDSATQAALRIGPKAQAAPLDSACDIADLAEWGEEHAVPFEPAMRNAEAKVLVQDDSRPGVYWLQTGRRLMPNFPDGALQAGMEACMVIGYMVKADGSVAVPRVVMSNYGWGADGMTRRRFENAALNAVKKWRYSPGPDNLDRLPQLMQGKLEFSIERLRGARLQCQDATPEALVEAFSQD